MCLPHVNPYFNYYTSLEPWKEPSHDGHCFGPPLLIQGHNIQWYVPLIPVISTIIMGPTQIYHEEILVPLYTSVFFCEFHDVVPL